MGPSDQPPGGGGERLDLDELVASVEAELEEIFARYCMTPFDAQGILADSLFVLRAREEAIHEPAGWLLTAVEDRCRRLVEESDVSDEERN
jgi:hypothetical protein